MRAHLVIVAALLSGCATSVQVRGPYASALSADDVAEIRRLRYDSPRLGRRTVTLMALAPDRVRIATRNYERDSWIGTTMYVVRRGSRWQIVENASGVGEAEMRLRIY